MDMANTPHMVLCNAFRITAAKQTMTCIKQQFGMWAGMFHQKVDLVFALNNRTHVMVIDECNTLRARIFGQCFNACTKLCPACFFQHRTFGERFAIVAMNGVRRFANDDDLASHGVQKIKCWLHCSLLILNGIGKKVQRMPARNVAQIAWFEYCFKFRCNLRKFMTFFDSVEADF